MKIFQFILLISITALVGTLLNSCAEEKPFEKDITQGIIEYEVTYPTLDSSDIMLEMLPDKMIMKFKDNKFISNMSAGAGLIEMGVLIDSKNQDMYNMVKIFGDRYVLKLHGKEVKQMTDVFPPFQLKELNADMNIADANCKKVLLDFGISKSESFIFYYTDEIKIENPNWYTPYSEIDGVLLDYRIENYNMNMRLKAIKITPQEISDDIFELDERYQELSKEEFDEVIVQNMTAFME